MLKSSKLSDRFKKKEIKLEENSTPALNGLQSDMPDFDNKIDIETEIKEALMEKVNSTPVWFEYSVVRQKELIKTFIDGKLNTLDAALSEDKKNELIEKLYALITGFGPLDYLLSQENVSAVFVNEQKNVHIEIAGKVLNTEITLSDDQLNLILNNIFKSCGVKSDTSRSVWNLKNENWQITIITTPVCENGTNIVIRKLLPADINTFFERNITSKEIFDFIVSAVSENKNIVISGDINSGKTFLLDVLLSAVVSDKRFVLIEDRPLISFEGANFMKFFLTDNSAEYGKFCSNILSLCPEYIVTDVNTILSDFSETKGCISTLRASSIDSAITKLTAAFMSSKSLTEKYAKNKVLTDFDYIVQINKMSDGSSKITSVVELKPARTAALSVKMIAKFVDGQYITEIPQPLTSIRAEALTHHGGAMYSRFYWSN